MKSCEASLRSEISNLRNQLSFANSQLKEFDDINAKLKKDIVEVKAKLERSDGELECLKIQGEQNSTQYNKTIEEKESYISDLLLQLKNDQSNANESKLDNTDDFKEMDSMEGG